jgi:hypothetical protein
MYSSLILQTLVSRIHGEFFGLHILELYYDENRAHCIARDTNIDDDYYEPEMNLIFLPWENVFPFILASIPLHAIK